VAFQQLFFSGDRPHGGAEKAAAEALERAEEGGREDPTADPFLFPLAYDDVAVQAEDTGDRGRIVRSGPRPGPRRLDGRRAEANAHLHKRYRVIIAGVTEDAPTR
jgi:hypothetical protein